ncbi:aminopeptidase [Sediminispirochaeta bajacaliforniensis]|uniref:aminopeptidase n=1 Tax=Sediminispirochaeta bajacaliforniensis TaxID=148 RepID=UPI0003775AC0|nr:aminopeptidase [Sediminispirochaeta bajacaliforniensis]
MKDFRLEKLASLLVNYSTKVKPGDFVFIMGQEVAIPWIKAVTREVLRAGGHPESLITSDEIEEEILKISTIEQLRENNFLMEQMMGKADVFLFGWGNSNVKGFSNIDPMRIQERQKGNKAWRKLYSDRTGTGDLRWCGTQFPTIADAQEAAMSLSEYEDFVYAAGLLDKEDPVAQWEKINEEQSRWARYLEGKKELHFRATDTDLKVRVDGRRWISCAGTENFPDGEIFSTPLINGVDGHVRFTFPAIYKQRSVEDVRFEIKEGRIVKAHAAKGEDFLHSVLDTDEGSRYFGEIAIGTNYGIKQFTSNTLFDEKIGGTFHMAAGDAPKETGGENESVIHWDMICDMRQGGEITADGECFYKDGAFITEILKE